MTDQNVNEPAPPVKASDGDAATAATAGDRGSSSLAEKLGQATKSLKEMFRGPTK